MESPLFSSKLLLVPLFQGFSRLDFLDIVEKIPFDFHTYNPREIILRQGEECTSLCILLGGEVQVAIESPGQTYRLTEELRAPWVVQQENLFGLHNRYARSVRAKTEVQVVRISKQSVRELLMRYPVFQMNFYNQLSTLVQRISRQQWKGVGKDAEERFVTFLRARSLRPSGVKKLHVHMSVLAMELGTTRLRVSNMLAEMSARQLLTHSRGIIQIAALERM